MVSTAKKATSTPIKDQVSKEEWQVRVDLAACYRLVAMYGWNDYIFNHISARVPGSDRHFLINPFGLFFDEVTASSLIKIDLDGNILLDQTGLGYNIGGYVIHGAVHEARESAHCVIHVHTTDGVAVSAHKVGLLPLNQDSMIVVDDIAYHDFEGVALDLEERERLIQHLGDKNLLILRNHGLLTIGETIAAAFVRMYTLHNACAIQVATLSGGVTLNLPSDAARKKVQQQVASRGSQSSRSNVTSLAWDGLLRKLDRSDQTYKD